MEGSPRHAGRHGQQMAYMLCCDDIRRELPPYYWQPNLITTGWPCLIVLHRHCIFYKLKIQGNPVMNKAAPFSSSICSLFVSHFGSFCNISNFFSILLYVLWWSVNSDGSCYYDSLKAQMMVSTVWQQSIFKLEHVHCFYRHQTITP